MTRLIEGDVNSSVTTVIENKVEIKNEIEIKVDLVKNLKKKEIKLMQKIISKIMFLSTIALFSITLSKNQSIKGHKIMSKKSIKILK